MRVIELHPRLSMLDLYASHAYLWRDPAGLTLVDTGPPGSAPLIAQAVEGLGFRRSDLRRVLLTHFHQDHIGSAADVVGWGDVEVYAHRADAPVIRGDAVGPPPKLADWEVPLMEKILMQMPSGPPATVRVDHELDDGEVLDLGGGVQAVAMAVPGHTPGSVAFHLPEPRVLFTGDTIGRRPDGAEIVPGAFNVDPALALTSFQRQARLDIDIACFGHGEPLTDNATGQLRAIAQRLTG